MEKKIGKLKVEFYNSKDVVPIKRFHKFQKMLMLDSDVGGSFDNYNSKLMKLGEYIQKDMKEQAMKEIENLRQNIFNIVNEWNPKHISCAVMVKSINGELIQGSDNGTLVKVIERLCLEQMTEGEVDSIVSEIKKKLKMN